MFEPELFGFNASQLQAFAAVLFTPTIGFVFLYLIGLPLKSLPIVDSAAEYRPPSWVLPIFALGSLFAISLISSVSIFLSLMTSRPAVDQFLRTFHKQLDASISVVGETLKTVTLTLEHYDGDSNFYIYVNGYRVFSSEVNCLMKYQCKEGNNEVIEKLFNSISTLPFLDNSLHDIHEKYPLPHSESILNWLVPGDNYIYIVSVNSGYGDCRLGLKIDSVTSTGRNIDIESIDIIPDIVINDNSTETAKGNEHTFHSYGAGFEISKDKLIEPYATEASDPSYRLCERLLIKITIDPKMLPAEVTDVPIWTQWASRRMRDSYCQIVSSRASQCSGKEE
jgi:hypothetical protein